MGTNLSERDAMRTTPAVTHPSSLGAATREILGTLMRFDQWSTLAWNDVKLRYRRTTLGPLWITLGLGATVFSVGILYGVLFGNELSRTCRISPQA